MLAKPFVAAAVGLLALCAPAGAQQPAAPDDPVVAIVDGVAVHRSQVEETARGLPEQYRQMPMQVLFGILLDRVIDFQLLANEADLAEVGTSGPIEELVVRRAQLAMEVGCDGVVASAKEAARLRRGAPDDFLIVTPGIRPAGTAAGDQKRVTTPREARTAGADLIVVGRPIRDAGDPAAMARQIAAELR